MKTVYNWKEILLHAWSMRIIYLMALINGAFCTVSVITGAMPTPPIWLALLNGVLSAATVLVRLIPQEKVSGAQVNGN
ncbi:putative holin [Mesorhizobium phage Cp1R7A-A1]|nr:putative holin [Mesorhizobium phage Cp1R7A-A1]